MYKIILFLFFGSFAFAKYDNCDFKNKDYEDICKSVVKKGVSYRYANKFLLDYFQTQKFDEITWKYLKPRYIKHYAKAEKKANKVLVNHIPRLKKHLQKYKKIYDKEESLFGINREIVASILLKETNLGKIKPTHDAFRVFNTLLVRLKPTSKRAKRLIRMSKTNMSSIITYCYKNGIYIRECHLKSSFAGAVGIPQFMPNSFIYAQGYKQKFADLNKMEDAIISVGKFLNKKAKFKEKIDWNKMPDVAVIEEKWYSYQVKHNHPAFDSFKCKDKKFLYFKKYVKIIKRYNNSTNYAMGILRLAYESR